MVELKPCPFCGGKGHYRFKRAIYYGMNAYGEAKLRVRSYVQCGSCKARGAVYGTTLITESSGKIKDSDIEFIKERLTEAWNRREVSFKTISELYRFPSCLIRDTANGNQEGETNV